MISPALNTPAIKTTSYKVVLPFYWYGALSFLAGTVLLFFSTSSFGGHYFEPNILAITHTMALGWATMLIIGASHQLVPVLIEGKLYSDRLAYASFVLAAVGIPLLVYGFYTFNMMDPAKWGGRLVVFSIIAYLINIVASMKQSKSENVHAVFVVTATAWLLMTVLYGLALVYNFSFNLLPYDSLHYLSLHAHSGIVGWFLLLVLGVGSRLIPMFLISKYSNPKLLWIVYWLINAALIMYFFIFYLIPNRTVDYLPMALIAVALGIFIYYCQQAYKHRLRKAVDEQMKISLLSVVMLLLPIIIMAVLIGVLVTTQAEKKELVLAYGFVIFFGWLTAIILGMTFKTLPFIVWNKVYRQRSASGKTPSPKDLFSQPIFNFMAVTYVVGFALVTVGIVYSVITLLQIGSVVLIAAAVLYNWNVIKVMNHKMVTV